MLSGSTESVKHVPIMYGVYVIDHAYEGFIVNTFGNIQISPRAYLNVTECILDKAHQ